MVDLLNILLRASRELPNDFELGYMVRRLLNETQNGVIDQRILSKKVREIIDDLKKKKSF